MASAIPICRQTSATGSGVPVPVREYIYADVRLIASVGPSVIDSATFTDNPIVAGTTLVKPVHVTELRSAINSARSSVGLSAASWTDSTMTIGTTGIKAVHISELRTALNAVYAVIGIAAPEYTDATLVADTTAVKAAHIQELRFAYAALVTGDLIMESYYHLDAVGSVRAVTDGAGNVVRRHDFTAFGEEISPVSGLDSRRFGSKERDSETGLDYFSARYYSPSIGVFASADDPGFGAPADPQTLNQYAYATGNPLRWGDPSGHQRVVFRSKTVGEVTQDFSQLSVLFRQFQQELDQLRQSYEAWQAEMEAEDQVIARSCPGRPCQSILAMGPLAPSGPGIGALRAAGTTLAKIMQSEAGASQLLAGGAK